MTERYAGNEARLRAATAVASWLGGGGFAAVALLGARDLAVVVGVVGAVVGLVRGARISVVADEHGLVVRNVFRTREVAWRDVTGFTTRTSWLIRTRYRAAVCPVAETRYGNVLLTAMPVAWRGPFFRRRVDEEHLAVVERWERTYLRYEVAA